MCCGALNGKIESNQQHGLTGKSALRMTGVAPHLAGATAGIGRSHEDAGVMVGRSEERLLTVGPWKTTSLPEAATRLTIAELVLRDRAVLGSRAVPGLTRRPCVQASRCTMGFGLLSSMRFSPFLRQYQTFRFRFCRLEPAASAFSSCHPSFGGVLGVVVRHLFRRARGLVGIGFRRSHREASAVVVDRSSRRGRLNISIRTHDQFVGATGRAR
jgi:hypothetical protein